MLNITIWFFLIPLRYLHHQDYPKAEKEDQDQSQQPKRPRILSQNGIIFCQIIRNRKQLFSFYL